MDTVPWVPAAGYSVPFDSNSTAHCIQPNLPSTSTLATSTTPFPPHPTPLHPASPSPSSPLYKYRQDYQTQPSLRLTHPGHIPPPSSPSPSTSPRTHGLPTRPSITAADVLSPSPSTSFTPSPLTLHLQAQRESTYLSHARLPLGRTPSPSAPLPPVTASPGFRFGLSHPPSEPASHLIYSPTPHPPTSPPSSSSPPSPSPYTRHRQASLKSLTRAEEASITHPTHRNYSWPSSHIDPLNPHAFRFGRPTHPPINPTGSHVKAALTHTHDEKETAVVDLRVVDHARATRPSLGSTKAISSEAVHRLHHDAAFRFGVEGGRDEWGAKEVVRGAYTEEEQEPDADLGKPTSYLRGKRGGGEGGEEEEKEGGGGGRVFGLPSIRTDRVPPKVKSVAPGWNWGDEGTSKALLYPAPYAARGLHDEDYVRERGESEVRAVFERVGVVVKERQWRVLVERAVRLYGALSVDSMRHAINRQAMELCCDVCGAVQCQHAECVERHCAHDGMDGLGNHRRFMTHDKLCTPLRRPAGAEGTGYTPSHKLAAG